MSACPANWPASIRNVVVTGDSRGLGLGIAKQLAIAGHQVIAVARKESDQLVSAMHNVHEQGAGSHHFRPFDLNEIAAPLGLVKELQGKFGSHQPP
jgi:3-oxoacyl-[acyl-carrier protein] reductase